jgi:hypothetical protein
MSDIQLHAAIFLGAGLGGMFLGAVVIMALISSDKNWRGE